MKRFKKLLPVAVFLSLLCGCEGFPGEKNTQSTAAQGTATVTAEADHTKTDAAYVTDFSAGMVSGKATGTDAETASVPASNVRRITITATGDCALGPTQNHGYEGSIHAAYDDYGEEYFLANFKDMFSADDFTLANLECALTELPYYPEANPDKAFFIVGHPEYARILTVAGVEGCSLGNNHSRDVGAEGLLDTEKACEDAGLLWALEENTAVYETPDGYKIGFVSAALFGAASSEDYMRQGIAKLKDEGVDLIFACCHWGIEKEYYPTDYQRRLSHEFIDLGADLIVGNHPHVVQGVEYYHGKVILYSLGNFCFGANHHPYDMTAMIYQQTFVFDDGELTPELDATIYPVRVSGDPSNNDYQPCFLEEEEKADMLRRVNEYSSPYSPLTLDDEGKISVDFSQAEEFPNINTPSGDEPVIDYELTEEKDFRTEETW